MDLFKTFNDLIDKKNLSLADDVLKKKKNFPLPFQKNSLVIPPLKLMLFRL